MNKRDTIIMFKVGDMYIESVSRTSLSLTRSKDKGIKVIEDNYDKDDLIELVIYNIGLVSSHGLDVDVVRHVVETREYTEDLKVVIYGATPRLVSERKED